MKVYTKTGDKGTTALVGGTRVSKAHPRVEAYGTVDELISCLGVVRGYEIGNGLQKELHEIQIQLMNAAALLAADEHTSKKIPAVTQEAVVALENAIDEMDKNLPPLRSFVLPAAPLAAGACHVARSVCRRAERTAVALEHPAPEMVAIYLNRLSDYLFVLSRKLTIDAGYTEETWNP